MAEPVILAFVVPKQGTVSVVSLSPAYRFKVKSSESEDPAGASVSYEHDTKLDELDAPLSMSSLTVVYGENGGGKTTLLLDICQAFSWNSKRDTRLGILWWDGAELCFDSGSTLKGLTLPDNTALKSLNKRNFRTIFYTTSPFEASRRRILKSEDVVDATPAFVTNNAFNGTAFFRAAAALPKDIDFIRTCRVRYEVEMPSLTRLVKEYTGTTRQAGRPSTPTYASLSTEQTEAIRSLPSRLNPDLGLGLAVEMHRAKLTGKKEATGLLLYLADVVLASTASDLNSAVEELLAQLQSDKSMYTTPQRVASAIREFRGGRRLVKAGDLDFNAVVDKLSLWSYQELEALKEAEDLGILQWGFVGLSSGQVALLTLFASVASALTKLSDQEVDSAILVLDEGEMFMHPAWQRKYLSDLNRFLAHYRENFNELHLILSTHSLIVAGDAPPWSLYDAKAGTMQNGFAYGPSDILEKVYGVEEFAGQMAEGEYAKIVGFLRGPRKSAEEAARIRTLIEQIASAPLKEYLTAELSRRKEASA